MKQFKNSFIVEGPKNLLLAFSKDCKEIGWETSSCDSGDKLSFGGNDGKSQITPNTYIWFNYIRNKTGKKIYTLPNDYSRTLEVAKETIEEAEEHILKQAIEESGLKIGDKISGQILNKYTSIIGNSYYHDYKGWRNTYSSWSNIKYIEGFKLIEGVPVIIFDNTDSDFTVKLEGLSKFIKEYQDQSIMVDTYKAEVKDGKLALETVKKLLNTEINAKIEIRGTIITLDLINKLEKLLQND